MYILIIILVFLCFINRYFQKDWSFHSIEMEWQKLLEEEKQHLTEAEKQQIKEILE